MTFKLIACEILFREICSLAASSPHRIDLEFLPKRLHDLGKKKMRQRLVEALDAVDETQYDAILLGYALCNGGTAELTAKTIPIVIPRAHDCITLFLGDRHYYEKYFFDNPGTYFETTGWLERGGDLDKTLEMMPFYHKLTYISTGIEPNDSFERQTQKCAADRQWQYEKLCGDLSLLRRLIHGEWNDDLLIVQPGQTIQFSYDDNVIEVR